MKQYIKELIYKAIQDINTYIWLLDEVHDQRKIMLYLNIEHSIGLYHGYMDCLRKIDKREYTKVYNQCEATVKNGLKEIENIYNGGVEK